MPASTPIASFPGDEPLLCAKSTKEIEVRKFWDIYEKHRVVDGLAFSAGALLLVLYTALFAPEVFR